MKVRNGIARSYVATAVKGLTVLAISTALTFSGAVTPPVTAVAATPVATVQAQTAPAARTPRQRAKVRVRARVVARAKARFAPVVVKKKAAKVVWHKAKVSWYGPGFYGHGMAGGGKLMTNSMVVAHKTLKFGTRIEFSFRGRRVIAVVKDRGPYVKGRLFDLGPGTAKALRFDKVGVGAVQYRVVK